MNPQKRALAIHDISCVGRCSLTVALPILSAAGLDTGVLPTAVLSTHTGGFEGFTYRDLTQDVTPIADHWDSLGLTFDCLYSGFLGSLEQVDLVADIFARLKKPDGLVMVDPVMADNGVMYSLFDMNMAKGMAKLCSVADVIVPNLTEAAFMLERPYLGDTYTREDIEELLRALSGLGAKQVVLTGVSFEEGRLGAAAYDARLDQVDYSFTDRIGGYFHGTGDVFGSALLGGLMNGLSLKGATALAVEYTRDCIRATVDLGQEHRYGVAFELALPEYMKGLGLL